MEFANILSNINVVCYIVAYLLGSIPFGVILVKLFAKKNLLEVGSKSSGATNVYRAFSDIDPKSAKKFSILTIVLDALKGLLAVLFAKMLGLSYETQYFVAILAIVGHCSSIFLAFNGGKGVATAIGTMIMLIPVEAICGLVIWAVVGKLLRISSISSLCGVLGGILLSFIIPSIIALPDSINVNAQIGNHVPLVLIGIFILYTHTENIIRLIRREEKKVM